MPIIPPSSTKNTTGAVDSDGNLLGGKGLLTGRETAQTYASQIDTAVSSFTGCVPNYHDITHQIPRWIRERSGDHVAFMQAYYDWLYCTGNSGANYHIQYEKIY